VAVVVAGDPDESLRDAALAIDEGLAGALRRPSDPGLRSALRGEAAPEEDDGLERVRRERRGLGFDEDDRPTLARLGRMAGADVLVVVIRREGALRAEVFDVHAERFYRDRLEAAPVDAVVAFTTRAARATRRRTLAAREDDTGDESAETARPDPPEPPTAAETAAAAVADGDAEEADDEPSPAREWFKKNWAFILAGALLVGVVAGFVVRSRRDDPELDAVIVFRPGE
jgi:hypothetical protein